MAVHGSDFRVLMATPPKQPRDWTTLIPQRPAPGKGNMTQKPPKPKTTSPSVKKGK